MKAGHHEEEYADGTSAAPWPQLDGVRPKTSPALVDGRRSKTEKAGEVRSTTDEIRWNTVPQSLRRVQCANVVAVLACRRSVAITPYRGRNLQHLVS